MNLTDRRYVRADVEVTNAYARTSDVADHAGAYARPERGVRQQYQRGLA